MHELRAVTGIAETHGVSWPTVMRKLLVTELIVLVWTSGWFVGLAWTSTASEGSVLCWEPRENDAFEPWSIVFTVTGHRHDP